MAGIKRKRQEEEEHDPEVEDPGNQDNRPPVVESDDEAEYYRQAVGEEPDDGMYSFSTEPSLNSLCFVVLYFCATSADKITFYIYFSPSHLDMFPAAKRRQSLERSSAGTFKKRKPFSGDDRKNKYGSKSPHRSGPRGKPRDRMGGDVDRKEGERFGDGGKSFGKMSPGARGLEEGNLGMRQMFGGQRNVFLHERTLVSQQVSWRTG